MGLFLLVGLSLLPACKKNEDLIDDAQLASLRDRGTKPPSSGGDTGDDVSQKIKDLEGKLSSASERNAVLQSLNQVKDLASKASTGFREAERMTRVVVPGDEKCIKRLGALLDESRKNLGSAQSTLKALPYEKLVDEDRSSYDQTHLVLGEVEQQGNSTQAAMSTVKPIMDYSETGGGDESLQKLSRKRAELWCQVANTNDGVSSTIAAITGEYSTDVKVCAAQLSDTLYSWYVINATGRDRDGGRDPKNPNENPSNSPLVRLDFSGKKLAELRPILSFVGVESLVLSNNIIADISPLGNLRRLQELELKDNSISNVMALNRMPGLTYANFANNRIEKIPPFQGALALRKLGLGQNPLKDISGLATLPKLEALALFSTGMTDEILAGGAMLPKTLKTLFLDSNGIKNLDFVLNFPALEQVDLSANPIADIRPLFRAPGRLQVSFVYTVRPVGKGLHVVLSEKPKICPRTPDELKKSGWTGTPPPAPHPVYDFCSRPE